jgi:hypothetical protein
MTPKLFAVLLTPKCSCIWGCRLPARQLAKVGLELRVGYSGLEGFNVWNIIIFAHCQLAALFLSNFTAGAAHSLEINNCGVSR